jgi:polysaccharide export outer membrane protein
MAYIKQFTLFLCAFVLITSSCSYKKRNILFKTPQKVKTDKPVYILNLDSLKAVSNYKHRIKVGDRLSVRFLNNYDIGNASQKSATASANAEAMVSGNGGYLVNYDSTVILPLLGRLNLVGLTRLEASARLETEYSKYIVNPIIDLNIASLGVTILGEINSPGKFYVDKENTTLIDVIALAGGIKDSGKKKNIKIIRDNEVILVDLKKIEVLQSQALIMHDNDIVYIEPYNVKAAAEPFVAMQPILTLTMTSISLALLITQFYLIYNK